MQFDKEYLNGKESKKHIITAKKQTQENGGNNNLRYLRFGTDCRRNGAFCKQRKHCNKQANGANG